MSEGHSPECFDPAFNAPQELAAQFNAAFASGPVLLALDFDGTLAELEDDPSKSHLTALAQRELDRIGAEFADAPSAAHHIALVSGRDLETLSKLAAAPAGTLLVGSHGAERGVLRAGRVELSATTRTPAEDALWEALREQFTAIAAQAAGAWVEEKSYAVVLHTRLVTQTAPGSDAEALISQGAAAAAALGVDSLRGKNVLEAPLREADKGTALQLLRAELGAQTVLYAGDDVTDEHAFTALAPSDFTVKVGGGPTAARFRLRNPNEVAQFLAAVHPAALDRV